MTAAPESLRERHRRATRAHIADAAAALFARHGYDGVTVDDVAREAGVARKTVFNHFPSKEDLVFDREDEVRAGTVAAIRDRPPGTTPVEALRAFSRAFYQRIASSPAEPDSVRGTIAHLVTASPALQTRTLQMARRQTLAVEAVLAAEEGVSELRAAAAARALVGVQGLLFERWCRRIADGAGNDEAASAILAELDAAYDVVAAGLARWPEP